MDGFTLEPAPGGGADPATDRAAPEPRIDRDALAALFSAPPPVEDAPPAAAPATDDQALFARVAAVIDEVRPFINMDGGDISLVAVEAGVVKVRMHGACVGCASSVFTLRNGIERRLKAEIPAVRAVEPV